MNLSFRRLVSLTFYFDFKSESQEEGKHVGVGENGVWEVATRRADASLFGLVYFNEQIYDTR